MSNEGQIGAEAAERAIQTTDEIRRDEGVTRRAAFRVIKQHLDDGSLKAADMALRVADAYPSEKHEVTHSADENIMSAVVRVMQAKKANE